MKLSKRRFGGEATGREGSEKGQSKGCRCGAVNLEASQSCCYLTRCLNNGDNEKHHPAPIKKRKRGKKNRPCVPPSFVCPESSQIGGWWKVAYFAYHISHDRFASIAAKALSAYLLASRDSRERYSWKFPSTVKGCKFSDYNNHDDYNYLPYHAEGLF